MFSNTGVEVHCARDLTRGGLSSALNEIAQQAGCCIEVSARSVPVLETVRGACELLGLDPLYVANEGRCVFFVDSRWTEELEAILHNHPLGENAAVIGKVGEAGDPIVYLESEIGTKRILDMLSGEQLPRIC